MAVNRPDGLQFARFLPRGVDGFPQVSNDNPQAVNVNSLATVLRLYALTHAADDQVRLWNEVIDKVRALHDSLLHKVPAQPGGKRLHLSCLVLDVEVGGILYAAAGAHGWIFAATLHQLAMNNGQAEKDLRTLAADVRNYLSR